jgi:aspartate-semialdehyde dehydrogenase
MRIAIVGATGAVGRAFIDCLEGRRFPADEVLLFATAASEGKVLHVGGKPRRIVGLTPDRVPKVDLALFSAGSGVSREYAPRFAEKGALVVDNSSAWRMEPGIPLVVPEVNPEAAKAHKGIIANPNCSTIQMVVALKPLHDAAGLKRVVVSTYQAVSGAGGRAVEELDNEVHAQVLRTDIVRSRGLFPRPIAFNAIPQIPQKDAFLPDGSTVEERKMVEETRKILGLPALAVAATCVRVPVRNAHSESVNVETERPLPLAEALAALRKAPGVALREKPEEFPTPAEASGRDEVFVGRVRVDAGVPHGLQMWVVADNLRKGAALNAVQIAELVLGSKF